MTIERVETLVVGGGQAGLAMSEHLTACRVQHVILERHRIAERWRTGRWDSLVTNGPAWHDRFPGLEFSATDPDAFPEKESVADYFVEYAKQIAAPIRCGVEVNEVRKNTGAPGFRIETSAGVFEADYVVAATGPFQRPIIPTIAPKTERTAQIHSSEYRNPAQLRDGAVLVVGAGSSGTQIADELLRAGRKIFLSVGPHTRYPRRYRGYDFVWWLGVLGLWDIEAPEPETEHVTIAVSGAHGGFTVDFRALARRGITLLGRAEGFRDGVMTFTPDLSKLISRGDADYLAILNAADAYIIRNGLNLPEEPEARNFEPTPDCVNDPVFDLNLADSGVTSIIWATGYDLDFHWLKVDAFDASGKPRHRRGVSSEPGIYFLGLPWLSRRGSSFIWGVWHDARYIAHHISTHRGYMMRYA
ncbi:MAG: FAD-dependent oxidoreductase [Rhodospirillaceae bacterium]|nr:FAD-dependent oxidoreductase [Rhodospirillaceae bacterium]